MEHNTDRILWTVLVLAIGVVLYIGFRPAANGLLGQGVEKIQTVATNVHGNTNDSSGNSSSSSSSNSSSSTAVGANLLTGTHADWQSTTTDTAGALSGWWLGDSFTANVEKNTDYTVQSEIKSDVGTDTWHVEVWGFSDNSKYRQSLNQGQNVNNGISQVTFNSGDCTHVEIHPHASSVYEPASKVIYWRHEKLEKGSVTTPWNP